MSNSFPNHTTAELFNLNSIYFREWEADKADEGKKAAVIRTGEELTRRGAW